MYICSNISSLYIHIIHKILYLSSALTFPISFLVCWFFPFSIFAIENHTLVSLSIFNPYPSSAKPTHSLIYQYRHRYTYVFNMYISITQKPPHTYSIFKSVATPSTSVDKMYKYVCMNVCIDDTTVENCWSF